MSQSVAYTDRIRSQMVEWQDGKPCAQRPLDDAAGAAAAVLPLVVLGVVVQPRTDEPTVSSKVPKYNCSR